jgi:CDP-glycerol glycerophosphotransferase (TagB/SpsB family)
MKQLDRKAILARLGLDPEKKTILVATSKSQKKYGRAEYDVIMVETLAKSFAHNKEIQVVIKLHPKEDGTVYRQIIRENKIQNFVIIDHPIEELILICDVFVAVATTTILEAVILEKPVIIFQTSEKETRDLFMLLQLGAAIRATNVDLENKVLELLNNGNLVELLKKKGSEFAKQHFNLPNSEINRMIADILIDPKRRI